VFAALRDGWKSPAHRAVRSQRRLPVLRETRGVTATLGSNYALTNLDRMLAGSVSRKLSNQGVSSRL
jgi:hypothetical protein